MGVEGAEWLLPPMRTRVLSEDAMLMRSRSRSSDCRFQKETQQHLHATEGGISPQSSYKGQCPVAEFITRGSLPSKITQGRLQLPGPRLFFFFFWYSVLFALCVRVLWHVYKGQRTNDWSQLSPSPGWVPGTELNLLALAARGFTRGSISLWPSCKDFVSIGQWWQGPYKRFVKQHLKNKQINLKNQIASTKNGQPPSSLTPSMLSLASGFQ